MGIQQFQIIMVIWYFLFFAMLVFCLFYAINSLRKNKGSYRLPYILEGAMMAVNVFFMYIIDHRYIDYGNNKFSGLSSMGDWLGFGMLLLITLALLLGTIICNIYYIIRKRKKEN